MDGAKLTGKAAMGLAFIGCMVAIPVGLILALWNDWNLGLSIAGTGIVGIGTLMAGLWLTER